MYGGPGIREPIRTKEMKLTLPYPPQVNHYYTVARGRKILSSKGRAYKDEVGWLTIRLNPLDGDLSIKVIAYRPRKVGDLDNVLKPVLDSLKGYAFHDDKQIVEIQALRRDDKTNPRVEVEIVEFSTTAETMTETT